MIQRAGLIFAGVDGKKRGINDANDMTTMMPESMAPRNGRDEFAQTPTRYSVEAPSRISFNMFPFSVCIRGAGRSDEPNSAQLTQLVIPIEKPTVMAARLESFSARTPLKARCLLNESRTIRTETVCNQTEPKRL